MTAPTASRPAGTATAQSAAEAIRAAIPEVTALIPITEDNDQSRERLRRGNRAGRLTHHRSVRDRQAGHRLGAGVEQWPDEAAAQRRADYIKTVMSSAPIFGTEYQTVKGNLLLRVSGKLKPFAAQAYQAAFIG